jgi:Uma2 family endonuclease
MRDSIARVVTFEEYLTNYAADYYECVSGELIRMAPVSLQHDHLSYYLRQLLETYLELCPIGRVVSAPFVLRLSAIDSNREPDMQVILNPKLGNLTSTFMDGAADICIEVVSTESTARDYGSKFDEYERGGVQEYWIIDPLRRECRFHRLHTIDGEHRYRQLEIDAQGNYVTPMLPQFALHVATLWQDVLPGPLSVIDAVRAMLNH